MFFKINLKKHRKLKGLTQQQLARKANITQQYIADLEKDIRIKSPTLDTIASLSIALEICPYSLVEFNCIKYCNKHGLCTRECF